MDLGLRKTYRANLTKLANSVNGVLDSELTDTNEISVLIARIKDINSNLNAVNERLFPTYSDDQIDDECSKIAEYQDIAVEAIAKLECRLKVENEVTSMRNVVGNRPASPENNDDLSGSQSNVNRGGNVQNTRNTSVRLPKLEIRSFNGDIASWPAFWEQFKIAVHENNSLNDAEKFAYLKSYLSGKAAVTITGLTSSQSSYQDAVDLLKDEYANSERIIDTYIQKLLSIPPVKHDRDIVALRKLYNTAATIVRSLSTLGLSPEQYGLLVKSIIFKALPYNMRIAFQKQKLKGDGNSNNSVFSESSGQAGSGGDYTKQIDKLLIFIKVKLDSIEQAQFGQGQDDKDKDKYKHLQKEKRFDRKHDRSKGTDDSFTAVGLLAFAKNGCLFCKVENHQSADCNGSLSINEKKAILKSSGCCYRCTKQKHNAKNCRVKIVCKKCKHKHATSMCDPPQVNNGQTGTSAPVSNNTSKLAAGDQTALLSNGQNNAYLKTARGFIVTKDQSQMVRLVIDGGSQLTFIKENVSRSLGLPVVGKQKISINGFGASNSAPANLFNRVQFNLRSRYKDVNISLTAIEVPEICFDNLNPPRLDDPAIQEFSSKYCLADVDVENKAINGISLLVGADYYWDVVTGQTKRLANDLMAVNTKLGWTLHGSRANMDNCDFFVNFNLASVLNVQTVDDEFDIKRFWDLETIGISANEKTTNDFTETFLRDNVEFKNGRYEVSLPWKTDKKLDSYYTGALARVKNLVLKLCRTKKLIEYDKAVREYINNDCAEIVSVNSHSDRTYFMPHRPVYREDKDTTKVRVVFDASAHAVGFASLNEQLFSGDNLVPDVLKVILNFRIGAIGLIADIEKAFLQISLTERDRDSHSFIWFSKPVDENNLSSELPEMSIYRMKRVTFGVTTSPFLLAVTLKKHFSNQQEALSNTATLLSQSFFVDDLVCATNSLEEALTVYKESKQILSTASMNLRKWDSNDARVRQSFKNEDKLPNSSRTRKVLGILWSTESDDLSIDLSYYTSSNNTLPTKRSILQTIVKIYDPLGIVGPFTVKAKILLQSIWRENIEWDAALPEHLTKEWLKWYFELPELIDNMRVPRCVTQNKDMEVELHIFADASPQAYGAVAYVRCQTTSETLILLSKNRVAPINKNGNKELTLPRLELTAALCAARLQCYIMESTNLNIKNIILWSDSKIALYWIRGRPTKWKPYVQHRVNEIQRITKGIWRYCPGKDNPADLLTRGVAARFLTESNFWLYGPAWLRDTVDNWPPDEFYDDFDPTIDTCTLINNVEEKESHCESIFPIERYSNLEKIFRVTAYILRFINNINKCDDRRINNLTVGELEEAERYWVKFVQFQEFSDEVTALRKGTAISSTSKILSLNPVLDENGILRLGSRLEEACLPYEVKYPIILPKKSLFTEKLIWKCHERMLHCGVNATLAESRRKYWIIQGRQRVKTIIGKCLKCKRLKGKAGNESFAPLPKDRITEASPFKVTGVDFAGPLYILEGNKRVKTYIMLLTCAVVRAVHLELVPNLSTESCVRGLRRFFARRGVPEVIYSDNAKTFRRVSIEIQELFAALRSSEVQELAQKYRIKWRFIIERAAWWGGFWERMVKTVKEALKITLGKAIVDQEELNTILTEVEATVNSRPLTYLDDDHSNLLALSPSHFLIGPKMNGLCLDPNLPEVKRNAILQKWKLVRVTEVFPGRDGRVRACEVRTSDGTKLRRPVQLLFPLEVRNISPREDVEN